MVKTFFLPVVFFRLPFGLLPGRFTRWDGCRNQIDRSVDPSVRVLAARRSAQNKETINDCKTKY